MAKKQSAGEKSLGNAVNQTEVFLENNSTKLLYILIAIVVVALLIFGYRALIVAPRADKAAALMTEAQFRFEQPTPDYKLALEGDDNGAGFLTVIDEYGSTPSGNLARQYAGICYLKSGDLDNAAKYLSAYKPVKGIPGSLINAQNYGLQGDIAVEQQNYGKAVDFYKQAIEAAENNLTAPMYLRKAGLAEMAQGNTAEATADFQQILDSYPQSPDAREAEKLLGTVR